MRRSRRFLGFCRWSWRLGQVCLAWTVLAQEPQSEPAPVPVAVTAEPAAGPAAPEWVEVDALGQAGRVGQVGQVLRVPLGEGAVMDFCWCPPGRFMMGSPLEEEGRGDDEGQAEVTLTHGFWLARTPCTQGQWQALMGTTPARLQEQTPRENRLGKVRELGDTLPMYFVSVEDAEEFSSKLMKKLKLPEGWQVALPTEAQWEYACRAGTQTAYYFGDQLDPAFSRKSELLEEPLLPVGGYPPNAWGLQDLVGCIKQICSSRYENFLRGGTDPAGAPHGLYHICRGSESTDMTWDQRSAARQPRLSPQDRASWAGFRLAVVRSATGSSPQADVAAGILAAPLPELSDFPVPLRLDEVLEMYLQEEADEDKKATAKEWHGLMGEAARHWSQGKVESAEAGCRAAIAHLEKRIHMRDLLHVTSRMLLSRCLLKRQAFVEAEAELYRTLALLSVQSRESDSSLWLRFGSSLVPEPSASVKVMLSYHLTTRHLLAGALLRQAEAQSGRQKASSLDAALSLISDDTEGWGRLRGFSHPCVIQCHQLSQYIKYALGEMPASLKPSQVTGRTLGIPPLPGLPASSLARLRSSSRAAILEADAKREEALNHLGDQNDAECQTAMEAAAKIYQRVLGDTHPLVLKCRAFLTWRRSDWKKKEDLRRSEYQTMLAQLERHVGKKDPWTLWGAERLQSVQGLMILMKQPEKEAAELLARRIVADSADLRGEEHMDTLHARFQLATLLKNLRRYEEAEKLLREVLQQADLHAGKSSYLAHDVRLMLGSLLLYNGDPQGAAACLQTALVFARKTGFSLPNEEEFMLDLTCSLILSHRPVEAFFFASPVISKKEPGGEAKIILPDLIAAFREILYGADKAAAAVGGNPEDLNLDRLEELGYGRVERLALLGDAECQAICAYLWKSGITAEKSPLIARRWLKLAAENGFLPAQSRLADEYMTAEASPEEQKEGLRWARVAAERGGCEAMFFVGRAYFFGYGVEKDTGLMLQWFEKSANQGSTMACRALGALYGSGSDGVGLDMRAACDWLARGAAQDDAYCLFHLGNHYYRGEGVPREPAMGVSLWRRAAEQGYPEGQYKLGLCYLTAPPENRLVKDPAMAYFWLSLAAAQGHKTAANDQKDIARLYLNKNQKAEMDTQVKNFIPRAPKPQLAAESGGGVGGGGGYLGGLAQVPPSARQHHASGTGFFITAAGHLVTNHHVIEEATTIRVRFSSGEETTASLITQDASADLALLKITPPPGISLRSLPLAPSRSIKLGASVATVGYPNYIVQGLSPKLARGDIASLAGVQDNPGQFQISVPLQPGNSGGALVDLRGNVVGVVCAIMDQEVALATTGTLASNVSYAVKSSLLMNLIESVPDLPDQLPPVILEDRPFEDMVETVQHATVMLLITRPGTQKPAR